MAKIDMTKDSLHNATSKTYGIVETIQEDITKKILSYDIVMSGEVLPKDNLNIGIYEKKE